jgi:hypothetical protein
MFELLRDKNLRNEVSDLLPQTAGNGRSSFSGSGSMAANGKTLAEVGKSLGLLGERIRQLRKHRFGEAAARPEQERKAARDITRDTRVAYVATTSGLILLVPFFAPGAFMGAGGGCEEQESEGKETVFRGAHPLAC